jgi:glycerophosphoryl diester phosphodiesterase
MLTIAHRGAKAYCPENTLAAFQKAITMNADGIELDVHLSSDGEIMVLHDETIDRLTGGSGFVKDMTLQQLKNFRISGTEEIPTLSEVLDLVNKKCLVNIELKVEAAFGPVTKLIEKYVGEKGWNYKQFLVSSFNWNALQEIRDQNPKIPLGVLAATDLELALSFSEFIKAETLHPHFHLLTIENVIKIQSKGIQVFSWTINEPEDIQKIKSYNVNGIITDFPDRI